MPLNELLRTFDKKTKKQVVVVDIPMSRRLRWACGIAEGVTYIHREGVVHRDLKSPNVIVGAVDGEEVAQLMDFGAAKILESVGGTMSKGIIGTPAYMAPEMFVMDAKRNYYSVDVYALSILVWETLSGEEPFGGKSEEEIRGLLQCGYRPTVGSELPVEVQAAICRGWAQEASERGTASEMRDALQHALQLL
jgi:serine/threonine protein kinase